MHKNLELKSYQVINLLKMQPVTDDSRFPGRGRTLTSQTSTGNHDSTLQARLLSGSNSPERISAPTALGGERSLTGRY